MTITLPPDLEHAVTLRAEQLGTNPDVLAIDQLRRILDLPQPAGGAQRSLAEDLGDLIGVLDSSEIVPGGARMSEDCGAKMAAGLLEKHRSGKQ